MLARGVPCTPTRIGMRVLFPQERANERPESQRRLPNSSRKSQEFRLHARAPSSGQSCIRGQTASLMMATLPTCWKESKTVVQDSGRSSAPRQRQPAAAGISSSTSHSVYGCSSQRATIELFVQLNQEPPAKGLAVSFLRERDVQVLVPTLSNRSNFPESRLPTESQQLWIPMLVRGNESDSVFTCTASHARMTTSVRRA